ncbi:hypothetical protein HO133_001878 [Letharia lupina]|uniref:Uncharacterized protein n=1 Tax=Letharia lupina TaxID=560253 RepID=A0A8H6CE38_9LECA|nr:uncharacterized protein HO133_001878 [Letharia lupina]KAF6221910.1 hypothetical protein HO133_001878 [Letharia lupina]
MSHSTYQQRDFATVKANWLAEELSDGRISWTDYLSRTVPVMVGVQSQGKTVECLPVVIALSEFFEVLAHDLRNMFLSDSNDTNVQHEQAILKVKWGGSGSQQFDGYDTMLLSSKNLEPTIRLLKQRQGTDMILLELNGWYSAGQVDPIGGQKVLRREGRKKQGGRIAPEGESGEKRNSGSHSDVSMEGTSPPKDVPMMEGRADIQPDSGIQQSAGRSRDWVKESSSQAARGKGGGQGGGGKSGKSAL